MTLDGQVWLGLAGAVMYIVCVLYLFREFKKTERMVTGSDHSAVWVTKLGLLAALAALMQGSAVYLPGLGMVLAMFSSLPMAVGGLTVPKGAAPLFLATVVLLIFIQVEEAFIFAFATGPVGIAAAWAVLQRRPLWQAVPVSGLFLGAGLTVLGFVIGVPPLGPAFDGLAPLVSIGVYITFGLLYSPIWIWLVSAVRRRLERCV